MGFLSIDSKFSGSSLMQQQMKHCIPAYSPLVLSCVFSVLGVSFCVFGSILIQQSKQLLYFKTKHENGQTEQKQISLHLNQKQPLALYYQIPGFYQNIRSYVQSFNMTQLASNKFTDVPLDENCEPTSPDKAINYPCGLIYKTRVEDVYTLSINDIPLQMNAKILHKHDIQFNNYFGKAFKQLPNWQQIADWMLPAPFKDVQKAYSAASQDELALLNINFTNKVVIKLKMSGTHNYSAFRNVVVAQPGLFGNKYETYALGKMNLAFGIVCTVCALLYLLVYIYLKVKEGPRLKDSKGIKHAIIKLQRTEPGVTSQYTD
ncbi:Cell_division protein 50 [Hexamita inflata]|uniref:Cell division protein 50 n=1 Tax=Hexamita inflata TaxID=28002 RepID=A0AA86V0M2_9EUKA|nr:Cell division protein 50 [Hexamita inflata]